jgi:hypothetical protein
MAQESVSRLHPLEMFSRHPAGEMQEPLVSKFIRLARKPTSGPIA